MKKYIIGFIAGALFCTTIGVTASVLYNSSEVGFTPSDSNWNVNTVQDAINDLYAGSSFKFNTVPLANHNYYQKEYDVEEGKYYIFCTYFPASNITVTGGEKL